MLHYDRRRCLESMRSEVSVHIKHDLLETINFYIRTCGHTVVRSFQLSRNDSEKPGHTHISPVSPQLLLLTGKNNRPISHSRPPILNRCHFGDKK